MKRMICSMLLLICAISLCSCSSKNTDSNSIVGEWVFDTYLVNDQAVSMDEYVDYYADIFGEWHRENKSREEPDYRLVFFDDGTCGITGDGEQHFGMKYACTGTLIKITETGYTQSEPSVRLIDGKIVVSGISIEETIGIRFKKK